MKIRITENQLRQMIQSSLLKEYVNKTDRKVINKNKMTGDYEQEFEGAGVERVPSYVVIVSNFQNPNTREIFEIFAYDRISKGGSNENRKSGVGYLNWHLNGTINQLFGTPRQTDQQLGSISNTQEDPINFTYSPLKPQQCPLEFDAEGFVSQKKEPRNFSHNLKFMGLIVKVGYLQPHIMMVVFYSFLMM